MAQARVVIRGAALEMGEHLLKTTRLASLTELINVMFSRYGRHLETTWEVLPAFDLDECAPLAKSVPTVGEQKSAPAADFTFDEQSTTDKSNQRTTAK
ncbi:hypothetical protein WKK05_41460 (plasmid) [Nostoc sp. UHCC 0302]|uniref:hypothetical protein n=1 Tax=Nostoc sp. UHCC 0302 TaxID=3134896 RepID=UPI00311CAAA4